VGDSVSGASYNERNQLVSQQVGGPMRVHGTLDEPGTVKVNGNPARMLAGNAFEATVAAVPGTNTFTVEATDASSNVTTQSYEVDVTGTTASYSYDANGNLTQKTEDGHVWAYTWNAENQLTRVTKDSAEVATFAYDPLGRRVEKVAGGVVTRYTYGRLRTLREIQGSTTLKFIHGRGLDEPLASEDSLGALTYLHADWLGSIVKHTNQAGEVVNSLRFDAWGDPEAGSQQSGYAFTGREWDAEASLYYYRARYYDPKAGRFLSEDPIGFNGDLNFYAYVGNRPPNAVDPLGLQASTGGTALPVVTYPPPLYTKRDPLPPAILCCHGGKYAACVEDGQYPTMSPKYRQCLAVHEAYHAKQAPCSACSDKPDCYVPPPEKTGQDHLEEQCRAVIAHYLCFMGSGEQLPNGANAEEDAFKVLLGCFELRVFK
jgi:RHS repeat-associated protein